MKRFGTRLAVLAAAGFLALWPSTAATAAMTIDINPGNVPTTAAGFKNKKCDPNQGGGPIDGKDIWVFVLPGNHNTTGDFISVTADFGVNGSVTITAAGDPDNFDNGGPSTSKAWIVTDAGWTLEGATAEISGTADKFNLTHTCPEGGVPSTGPSARPSGPAATGGGGGSTNGGMALGIGALAVAGVSGLGLALVRSRRRAA